MDTTPEFHKVLSDEEIIRIYRAMKPSQAQFLALTIKRWKEGVDVYYPTILLRRLIEYNHV